MGTSFNQPGPIDQYLKYLAAGQFKLQRSRSSGKYYYYPRAFTLGMSSRDVEWVDVSGLGRVYSSTIVRRSAKHGGDFNIALVELDEGPRMLTRVLGISPDEVEIGMRVRARIEPPSWEPAASHPLVVFYPEAS